MRFIALALIATLIGCQPDEAPPPIGQTVQAAAHAGRWAIPAEVLQAGSQARVTITEAGPWRGEASCSGTFTRGAQRLKEWMLAHWPQVTSVGGYSCRAINGNGNVTSIHAVGRALDVFIPLDGGEADNDLGDALANYLIVEAGSIGIQRVIWDRSYWRAGNDPREGAYNGAHPHHDHLHVELSVAAGNEGTPFFEAGLPPPDRGPCGDPLPAAGGEVDDGDDCFTAFGPGQFWRSEGGVGVGGSLLWTNAFGGANPSNWALWRFRLQAAGDYAVEVHTAAAFSRFDSVRYEVAHRGGVSTPVVDVAGRDGWTRLGEWGFAADAEYGVKLFDNYAPDPGDDVHLTADAIRLVPAGAVPPRDAGVPPRDATAPPPLDTGVPPRDAGVPPPRDASPRPDRPTRPEADAANWSPDFELPSAEAGVDAGAEAGGETSSLKGGCHAAPGHRGAGWLLLLACLGLGRRWAR